MFILLKANVNVVVVIGRREKYFQSLILVLELIRGCSSTSKRRGGGEDYFMSLGEMKGIFQTAGVPLPDSSIYVLCACSVNSPARSVSINSLTFSGEKPCPKRNINFVMAHSEVESCPLVTPIFNS